MQSADSRLISDLLQAVRTNRIKDCKRLIDILYSKPSHGFSCLGHSHHLNGMENIVMAASALSDTSILEHLIKKGASVNFCSETQPLVKGTCVTPLHIAVSNGLHDCMEVLLKANADVNSTDSQGRTPLHIAAWRADCIALRLLLHRGADVLAINRTGETALQIASRYGHVELVRILLEYGAAIFQEGQKGASPLHIAASEGHVPLIDMFAQNIDINILCECTARVHQAALHVAAKNGLFETVRFIIERYFADVNILDSQNRNALHYAVSKKHTCKCIRRKEDYYYVCEFLLLRSINVNQQDNAGMTALHMAAHNQFHKIAELMFMHGANVNLKDKLNKTAWDYVGSYDMHTKQVFTKFAPRLLVVPVLDRQKVEEDEQNTNDCQGLGKVEETKLGKEKVKKLENIIEMDSCQKDNLKKVTNSLFTNSVAIVKEKVVLNDGRTIYKTIPKMTSN